MTVFYVVFTCSCVWLAAFCAYWKGRDDGVKAERERWTKSFGGAIDKNWCNGKGGPLGID